VPDQPDPALLLSLGVDPAVLESATPRRGTGCAECGQTGYRGRVGVFEVLVVDQELRHVLVSNPTEQAITEAARDMPTLFHSALAKAIAGETTFEEVLRVSPQE
jgi:type IV pilus assembly protein PilB